MEFHDNCMELHGIPWSSMELHENPWSSIEFHGIPWKSITTMEFHGIVLHSTEFHGNSCKSMESHDFLRTGVGPPVLFSALAPEYYFRPLASSFFICIHGQFYFRLLCTWLPRSRGHLDPEETNSSNRSDPFLPCAAHSLQSSLVLSWRMEALCANLWKPILNNLWVFRCCFS